MIIKNRAFSLVELSVVLTIIGVTLAGALDLATRKTESDRIDETNTRLDAIEEALELYLVNNQSLPCPADNSVALTNSAAGVAGAANSSGCAVVAGGNFNSGNVYNGAVPTKTLGLPDKYMSDDWDRRFTYVVDFRFANNTTTNASCDGTTSTVCFRQTSSGSITVRDSTGASLSTEGVYVIISHGKNGHGAWVYTGSTTRLADSSDPDEVENAENLAAYDAIFVQKDSTSTFDDIVRYKPKWQLIEDVEGVTDTTSCSAADSPASTCTGETGTTCTDMATQEKNWCLQP